MHIRLCLSALALACLSACNTGPAGDATHAGKFGVVRDACGSTDGPAVSIVLTDSEINCQGGEPSAAWVAGIQGVSVGSLQVGLRSDYKNLPLTHCNGTDCVGPLGSTLEIRLLNSLGGKLSGSYQTRLNGNATENGTFEVKKCPAMLFCPASGLLKR